MRWNKSAVCYGLALDTAGRDHHLRLKLIGAVAQGIIVDAYRRRPALTMIFRSSQENIGVTVTLIRPCEVKLACLRIAGKSGEREGAIAFRREPARDIVNRCYQNGSVPGGAAVG